jgi:AraC family transcriptional regulator, transcriptional activator FtrA
MPSTSGNIVYVQHKTANLAGGQPDLASSPRRSASQTSALQPSAPHRPALHRPALHRPAQGPREAARHQVVLVAYDGLAMFEFGVAFEVFGTDWTHDLGVPWYEFAVCAATPPTVTVEGGYQLQVPAGLNALDRADTVLVPPTESADQVPAETLEALRRAHRSGARVVSLCTGAFVLAAAGLLSGQRATTHWSECAELARRYPDVEVDPAVLYVDSGDIMTSAGSAASIDLCLHLVRQDYGAEVAARLARQLVVPPYRDGGQAQYIDAPLPVADGADLFTDTLAWMQAHLDLPLTVDDLASRSAMSRRTFARRFAAATGTTPYQWLLRQRLQLAQRLLETSDLPVDSIAEKTGFATAANLRKHFGRHVRTTPQAYRRTFRARDAAPAGVA